jgi:hypothetical protein
MNAERPEPIESVDERQFTEFREQVFSMAQEPTNCPECGCGFFGKYEDGTRICYYCPNRWVVK